MLGKAIGVLFVAAFVTYILDRLPGLNTFVANRPGTLEFKKPQRYVFPEPLKEKLHNCEDAFMVRDLGYAVISCDPGRHLWNPILGNFQNPKAGLGGLFRYRYNSRNMVMLDEIEIIDYPELSEDGELHPYGIEYHHESKTMWVVNHHSSGARIEVFTLDLAADDETPTATYVRSIEHPLLKAANNIAAISAHEFYISNCQYFMAADNYILNKLESYFAPPLASVLYVNMQTDEVRIVARLPFANGVTFMNATTLAVASTSRPGVYFYSVNSTSHDLTHVKTIRTKYFVDNLSVDDKGVLLLAGHPHFPTLEKIVTCRKASRTDGECANLRATSWIQEWTEKKGFVDLYVGDELQGSTTALRDAGWWRGVAVGLYGDGLMLWGQTESEFDE